MRCPPSSGNSLISWFSLPWSVAAHGCLKGTPAPGLGGDAGVRVPPPVCGCPPRSTCGGNHHPSTIVRVVRQRSVLLAASLRPIVQMQVPALSVMRRRAAHQLISGRHSEWLHHKPPCLGQRAGRSGPPFFHYGVFQPVVDAVPCPGLRRADPGPTEPRCVCHRMARCSFIVSSRVPLTRPSARRQPCGTTPCLT